MKKSKQQPIKESQLTDFIALIKKNYTPTDSYEPNLTLTMTTTELIEKVQVASGEYFDTQAINELMKSEGFTLSFVAINQCPNFYWLLQPII